MIGEMSSSDWIITDSHLVLFMRKVSARNGPFESRLWERIYAKITKRPFESRLWERIYAKITKRKTLNWRWGKSSRSRPIWVRRFQPQWNRIDETCFRHDVCKNVWKTYFLRTLVMSWQNCFYGAFGVSEFTIDLQKGIEFNKFGNLLFNFNKLFHPLFDVHMHRDWIIQYDKMKLSYLCTRSGLHPCLCSRRRRRTCNCRACLCTAMPRPSLQRRQSRGCWDTRQYLNNEKWIESLLRPGL